MPNDSCCSLVFQSLKKKKHQKICVFLPWDMQVAHSKTAPAGFEAWATTTLMMMIRLPMCQKHGSSVVVALKARTTFAVLLLWTVIEHCVHDCVSPTRSGSSTYDTEIRVAVSYHGQWKLLLRGLLNDHFGPPMLVINNNIISLDPYLKLIIMTCWRCRQFVVSICTIL